jgi:hypothetical protein
LFSKLLKSHWLEESQHARIDQLELKKMGESASPEEIKKAVNDYFDLLGAFDGLLKSQAEMDAVTFERATGRSLSEPERVAFITVQHRNYRELFLNAGLNHKMFVETLAQFEPQSRERVASHAAAFS